jgi:hypothetical protein
VLLVILVGQRMDELRWGGQSVEGEVREGSQLGRNEGLEDLVALNHFVSGRSVQLEPCFRITFVSSSPTDDLRASCPSLATMRRGHQRRAGVINDTQGGTNDAQGAPMKREDANSRTSISHYPHPSFRAPPCV